MDECCKELAKVMDEVLDAPMEHGQNPASFDDAGWKRGILKIIVTVMVFVGVFALTMVIYFPHSVMGKQEANLRLASRHLPILEERLRHMDGAARVKVGRYTGLGGSISVDGDVPDQPAAEAVVREIMATHPPVPVTFNLTFAETNILRRIVQPAGTPQT